MRIRTYPHFGQLKGMIFYCFVFRGTKKILHVGMFGQQQRMKKKANKDIFMRQV